jgi:hypothetical protein
LAVKRGPVEPERLVLKPRVFVVHDRPYCYWHPEPAAIAGEFLSGLKPAYFEEVAEILEPALAMPLKTSAASLIRLTFGHAVEALFSTLFAALQAPFAPHVWLSTASTKDLREVVRCVVEGKPFHHQFIRLTSTPTWKEIATLFSGPPEPAAERVELWSEHFGEFWSSLAHVLLDETAADEYNAIKHGLRVTPSSHFTVIGDHVIADAEFGSRFFRCERVGEPPRHIKTKMCARNWDPHGMARGLRPIADSIQNIVATLVKLNAPGVATDVELSFPDDVHDFTAPWSKPKALTTTTLTFYDIAVDRLPKWDPDALLRHYAASQIQFDWHS